MSRIPVNFFFEEIKYTIKNKNKLRTWINRTLLEENKSLEELNFIFCSDDYLLHINQQYLQHNTYTDIITFDNSSSANKIVGDIFISIDRIKENAQTFNVSETEELHRIIIHGTLHLSGYEDKTKSNKNIMTLKEDEYLALRNF